MGKKRLQFPLLRHDQRLFVATGKPWNKALDAFRDTHSMGSFWSIDPGCRTGDIVLMVLATTPRVALGMGRVSEDHLPNEPVVLDPSHTVVLDRGLSVAAVENLIGYQLRGGSVHEPGYANGIVLALNSELAEPTPLLQLSLLPTPRDPMPSMTEVWQQDSTSIVGRNNPRGSFSTHVVLYAPTHPREMLLTLATIVNVTFSGDLSAALRVLLDEHECWEILHPGTTSDTQSWGLIREREMPDWIEPVVVPGVGIALAGATYPDISGESRLGKEAHGEALWGYFFDPDGTVTVLAVDDEGNQIWEPWSVYPPEKSGIRPA